MAQFRTSRLFDVIFLLVLGGLLWWAVIHRVAIGDWLYFRTYEPTARATEVADSAGLTPLGRQLYFRTNPQFASEAVVAAECDVEELGCLNERGQAYILDDPRKPTQAVVTGAHEMLHLGYRRLSSERKAELAPLIDQALAMNTSPTLTDELRHETNAEDRRDEAHSLLGTEYQLLPAELETYYATYFVDRSKVVAAEAASER